MSKIKSGRYLARFYGTPVVEAYAHREGNWWWNLNRFPGGYFDDGGVKVFQTEGEYRGCIHLTIGPNNTGIRHKDVGMSLSDVPGYVKLNPPPGSL